MRQNNVEPLLTKLSRWWLKNYNEIIRFWVGMHWCALIYSIILGKFKGIDFGTIAIVLFCAGVIANTGLLFLGKAINWHMKNKIPKEQQKEFYELMKDVILRKTLWRYK